MVKPKNFIRGAMLLPFFLTKLYSFTTLSISSEFTDNLRFLNMKEEGNISNLNIYFQERKIINFENESNFYTINLDMYTLIFENSFYGLKEFIFKTLGNRDKIYGNFYIFYPTNYEIYQFLKIFCGNDLTLYLKNKYLFSINPEFNKKYFFLDSIEDMSEIYNRISISIPMPFFFLNFNFSPGIRKIKEEMFYFYEIKNNFDFPMTFDFSILIFLNYFSSRQSIIPIQGELIKDPFFEEEIKNREKSVGIKTKKFFLKNGIELNFSSKFFEKEFLVFDRKDKGIENALSILKFINEKTILEMEIKNLINFSNLEEFEYTRNALKIKFGLIF